MLNIRKAGQLERGVMIALAGDRGAGKTTTAGTFPKPLVLCVEDGSQALAEIGVDVSDVPVVKGQRYKDTMLDAFREVAKTDYRTVVVDSVTAMLSRMTADIVDKEKPHLRSLMKAAGGYGAGRDILVRDVEEVIGAALWIARERGMHVCWVFHTKLMTVSMPDRDSYDSVVGDGQKDAVACICNPCDVIAIVQQSMSTIEKGDRVIVEGDGTRELLVGPHPALFTKSRFSRSFETIPIEYGKNPLPEVMK